jgi:hypothetical protein
VTSLKLPKNLSTDLLHRFILEYSWRTILAHKGKLQESRDIPIKKNKGPDNPICQCLPIMGNKCCSGTGKEGKTKEVVKEREVKAVVWGKVVCERWCVTKRDSVCDKGVCERWCV